MRMGHTEASSPGELGHPAGVPEPVAVDEEGGGERLAGRCRGSWAGSEGGRRLTAAQELEVELPQPPVYDT